jgi:trimeric autotransporter adhesin
MSQKNCCHSEPLIFAAKRIALAFGFIAFLLAVGLSAGAQMQMVPGVTTVVGNGTAGYSGDGGPATSAEVHQTEGVTTDSAGNLYIADWTNNVIRKVTAATGVITTVAGNGTSGFAGDGGAATSAELKGPTGIAVDNAGNLYIADQANNRIREVAAATGVITTVAGSGTQGFSGDGGQATSAAIYSPTDLTFDSAGNLYISDNANNRIRKVTIATGVITTVVGNGTAGFTGDGAAATSAELDAPAGLAFDSAGNLYIADVFNNRIRKVAAGTGVITTYAGNGTAGFAGDGGAATSAEFSTPARVALDKVGNLFIADQGNNRVREIFVSTGIITAVAGNGTAGFSGDGGPGTAAAFDAPIGISIDSAGNLYISDFHNNRIRKLAITANNFPTTTIGASSAVQNILLQTAAAETITSISVPQSQGGKQEYSVGTITGCTVNGTTSNPAGTVCTIPITFTPAYPGQRWLPLQVVTSTGNTNFGLTGIGEGPLVALTPGIITTVAGTGTGAYAGDGGPATSAEIFAMYRLTFDSQGNLYIVDYGNNRVRKVAAGTGIITTVAGIGTASYSGDGGAATSAGLQGPQGVAVDSAGNLYIADYGNNRVRKVAAGTGIITTVAGIGTATISGDGGPATSAGVGAPSDVAVDSVGNLYITDYAVGYRIRKVAAGTGIITTVAGNGTAGFTGDGGAATSAELNQPMAIAVDSAGDLYIVDQFNNRIRKVAATTGIITTVAGNGTAGFAGDGAAAISAELYKPAGLAIDSAGNLYIGDEFNQRVRKVDAGTGVISTLVGNGTAGFTGDGGPANVAKMSSPVGVSVDSAGNLYISDYGNNRIRKVDISQSQLAYPMATTVGTSDSTDNPQTVTVENVGNASLTVPPPTAGSSPSVSLNFALDAATTCPQLSTSSASQTLGVDAQCTYAIDFAPTAAGAITGSAVLTDNSLNVVGSTQTVHLNGTGVAASTTTTLTSSLNPSIYGQSVTFTATVAPTVGTALPTGTVQFSVDGTAVGGPVTLNGSGVATFFSSTLAVGAHSVTAVYTPSSTSFTGSTSAALSQTVTKGTLGQNGLANIALASSPNPSAFAQLVIFTATVPNGVTGTVQFVDGGTVLNSAAISGTTATFTTSTLAVGTHPVTAVYGGDTNYNTATSAIDNQVVTTVATSTTTLSVAPSTVMYGNPATLTAVVAPTFATGTVSFYEGTTLLGTASIDGTGTAVLPISTLNAGVHNIVAKYNGDTVVPASTSNPAQLTVTQRTAPGGGPAITVTVNDAARTTTQSNPPFTYSPSGQLVNGDTYATAISGTAAYSTTAGSTPGTFSITVTGLASANYTIAFVPGNLTVTISPSSTMLMASPSSSQYGDPVTLTATVTSGATGNVNFYDGSILLGTGTVSNGIATLTTTTLNAGTHSVTATYNGDATYASSQSGPATVIVAKKTASGGGAALTITVQNASRSYGTSDPQFSYVITGTLVNGDTYTTAVTGAPTYSSADTSTSSAGSTFPISVNGLSSANYEIALVSGTLTIVAAPTTTMLATSTNSVQYGDPVTLTATVAPSDATGNVVFMNGSTVLGIGSVSGGVAILTTTTLAAGTYTITSSYQGDTDFGASTSSPVSITVNPRTAPGGGAALTVTVSNASRAYGQGNPAFSYTVTGTLVNGDTYATAVAGVPVYSTPGMPTSSAGTYPISVADLNSGNYVIAFVNGTLSVTKATLGQNGLANVTLVSSPNPSAYQQSVIFTATVPSGVTGTVQFVDGTVVLGTGTISGTTAIFTTDTFAVGTHPVTAVYSGDTNYNTATSAPDNQVVSKTAPALSPPVISPINAPYGTSVTITEMVPPGVTGTVTIYDGTTPIGTATINNGMATITTTSLPVGTDSITAATSGDSSNAPATSPASTDNVGKATPTLPPPTIGPMNAPVGTPVTITQMVPPGETGTVTFYDGSTPIGTATINNGVATITTTSLLAGTDSITVVTSGDSNYSSSTTPPAVDTPTGVASTADFIVGTTTPSLTTDPGSIVAFTITVAPITGNTFNNPVTLTVTGLPANFTSSFAPLTVTPGSGTVTSQMSVQTFTQIVAALEQRQQNERYKYVAFSCMLLPLLGFRRIRKRLSKVGLFLVLGIAALGTTSALTGCGGGYFGPPPASYPLTVTGTSGSLQHSTTVTLNVR